MTQSDIFSRYSRASLSLDSVGSQTDDESSNPSPASATARDSPLNGFPASGSTLPQGGKDIKLEGDGHPSPPGLQSVAAPGMKVGREKRKRSRVTSEQLAHLERAFQAERSPTAHDRRVLSAFLGMHERQTQIWFQNRRAKAKVQDSKQVIQAKVAEKSPKATSVPAAPFDADIKMIHEDGPVTIIPCTDLTIGTWRRVSSGENTHDLVAYVCDSKRCLNWFIHSNGYGFKMEIPFNTITDTEYEILEDRTAITCFILSHPPIFYLETVSSPLVDKPAIRTWKRCSDWTEGHQASHILRHTVVGSETHLANVLRNLHSSAGVLNMGSAHRSNRVMTSPMELQPPPLAALTRDGPSYQDTDMKMADAEIRRGSLYSTPNDRLTHERSDLRPPPHTAPAASFPRDSLMRPHAQFDSGMYNGYTSNIEQRPDSSSYSTAPAGLPIYSRPYATQPQPYFHDVPPPRMVQPFQADVSRAPRPIAFHTPSPPLMTPNYDSNMNRDRHLPNPHYESPQPMQGMPGMMYEVAQNSMRSR